MSVTITYLEDEWEDAEEFRGQVCRSCDGDSSSLLTHCVWCGVESPVS